MDIKTRIADLQKSIYLPSIFYIPYVLFPDLSEESIIELEDNEFFNTLGIITERGEVGSFKNKDSLNILVKPTVLRQNVFQLLEMKGHLQNETFNMVLDDYWSTVNFWDHIYEWLRYNVEQDIPTIRESTITLFNHQSDAIKAHLSQLQVRFQVSATIAPINRKELLERHKDLIPLDQKQFGHIFKKKENVIAPKDNTIPKGKLKKTISLPSDAEVDVLILKRVFNVKL